MVKHLRERYRVGERRACRVLRFSRTSNRYESIRDTHTAVRARMREIAATRVRYGYRKVGVLLRREGWMLGKNLLYRLYREEGLSLRYRPGRKRRSQIVRSEPAPASKPNERWSLDFVT